MRAGTCTRLLLTLALCLTAAIPAEASAAEARIVSEQQIEPRVLRLTIETPAFSEPTKVEVNLPTGYDADPNRRWPVTYFLAGTQNTYRTFNTLIDGVGLTAGYPGIVVSPNGDSGYWSDWYNGGAMGPPKYETYVADQLIDLIDARFRTVPDRSQRTVFGASMGGYGALMMAARHPDLFVAAGSISGALNSNLQPHQAVLSLSPTFQGAQADAIYGPRLSQEVRWRGHNPWDIADNLRTVDVQVRTANGIPNPGIGENLLSVDSVSCIVELGVSAASRSMHARLQDLDVPHEWRDYGPGCHTKPNFTRETADTLAHFQQVLARPSQPPASFDFAAIEPAFGVWGWDVAADPARPLEFMRLQDATADGLTLTGSGTTTVTTPPQFKGVQRVDLKGAREAAVAPDADGRMRFTVDLGPANARQQYTSGATTRVQSATVTFEPHATVTITKLRPKKRKVRVCVRSAGGEIRADLQLTGRKRSKARTRLRSATIGAEESCMGLKWKRRPLHRGKGTLRLVGQDRFGHPVQASRSVKLRAPKRR